MSPLSTNPAPTKIVILIMIQLLFLEMTVASVAESSSSSSTAATTASTECPVDCEPNGVCHDGECVCQPGFAGADCSFPFETCPDGIMQCFGTGAICVPISTREQEIEDQRQHPANGGRGSDVDGAGNERPQYQCDCSAVTGESPFQISECESPESQVCEEGHSMSQYAFCTNGGKCVAMIRQGMPHAGCHCTDGFEGRHCQYLKGTAPKFELQLAYQEEKNDLDPIIKLWITLVCLVVITAFAFMVFRRHFKRKILHPKFFDAAECGPVMYDQTSMSKIEVSLTDLPEINSTYIESGSFVYNENELSLTPKDVDKTVDCSTETEEETIEEELNGLAHPAVLSLSEDERGVDKGEMA